MARAPGYWTKERMLRDARRFKGVKKWERASSGAYDVARRLEILKQATQHMIPTRKPQGYWTPSRILKEAKKFETPNEWRLASQGSYLTSFKLGLHAKALRHMQFRRFPKYSLKDLRRIARKYKTKKEFKEKAPGACAFRPMSAPDSGIMSARIPV